MKMKNDKGFPKNYHKEAMNLQGRQRGGIGCGLLGSGLPGVLQKLVYIKQPVAQRISRQRYMLRKRSWILS